VEKFNLPKLADVFTKILDQEELEGDRGSPGNEDQHYKGKVQVNDYIEAQKLNYAEGCIVKRVDRYRRKNGLLDLAQIVFFTYRLMTQWLEEHPEDAKLFGWQADTK